MPVELRKRKAVEPAPAPPTKKKGTVVKAAAKVKEAITGKAPKTSAPASKPTVGQIITLQDFGGEVTNDAGEATSLKKIVDESNKGVIIFTYPRASTPGCTTQACLFRDSYDPLTKSGYSIYGLSTDSPKANTTFKVKNKLPYALLCDPSATLIAAIGLKKSPSGTQRGVFVVDKAGKVLAAQPGSPAGTVDVVKKLLGGDQNQAKPIANGLSGSSVPEASKEDVAKANVAADVADTAEKLDSNKTAAV